MCHKTVLPFTDCWTRCFPFDHRPIWFCGLALLSRQTSSLFSCAPPFISSLIFQPQTPVFLFLTAFSLPSNYHSGTSSSLLLAPSLARPRTALSYPWPALLPLRGCQKRCRDRGHLYSQRCRYFWQQLCLRRKLHEYSHPCSDLTNHVFIRSPAILQ